MHAAQWTMLVSGCLVVILVSGDQDTRNRDVFRDRWMMVFSGGINMDSLQEICDRDSLTGECHIIFRQSLKGVAGQFSDENLASLIDTFKGRVASVERDSQMRISDPDADYWDLIERRKLLFQAQENPEWGLDLIDQISLPLDNYYRFNDTGKGVNVYVLDTGIRTTHAEFTRPDGSSRAIAAFSAIGGEDPEDCHGHGSHVAAVVGGNTFGVAKDVTLHSVKVLGCNGGASYFSLLKGLEWVASNHVAPAVAVMSVNGRRKEAINVAVENLINQHHVHVIVASGNSNTEACSTSPASVPSAITVGAVNIELQRYRKSNWGPCVDIHAPGVGVLSAGYISDTSELRKSGTSMACPFAAGVVARYLEHNPGAAMMELSQKLVQSSVKGQILDDLDGRGTFAPHLRPGVLDISSTPNRLLHANLVAQASIRPSLIEVTPDWQPIVLRVKLVISPSHPVQISAQVPEAWDGGLLGKASPETLYFDRHDYDHEKQLIVNLRSISQGHFYIFLWFRSEDHRFDTALQAVRVLNFRPLDGESVLHPRVIRRIPFVDVGDSTVYKNTISYKPGEDSLDVVYSYEATEEMDVDISTCGSQFDTTLAVFKDASDRDSYLFNDDSPSCTSNTANSRISTRFQSGTTYYIVVDGYRSAAGHYTLSVKQIP